MKGKGREKEESGKREEGGKASKSRETGFYESFHSFPGVPPQVA